MWCVRGRSACLVRRRAFCSGWWAVFQMLFWKFRSGSPANQALLLASSSLHGPLKGCADLRLGQSDLWLRCRRAIAGRIHVWAAHRAQFHCWCSKFLCIAAHGNDERSERSPACRIRVAKRGTPPLTALPAPSWPQPQLGMRVPQPQASTASTWSERTKKAWRAFFSITRIAIRLQGCQRVGLQLLSMPLRRHAPGNLHAAHNHVLLDSSVQTCCSVCTQ